MIEVNEHDFIAGSSKDNSRKVVREGGTLKRIDFCGNRCYQRSEGVYYPSVTSILSAMPADPFFLQWIQDVGKNSELIRDKAAREGTQVHEGIEKLLKGEKLDWVDEYGNARYNLTVWKMLLKFQDFYNLVKPQTLASEMFLYSDKYQYAGTTDYLCQVANETWLIDFKTSNHIGLSYDLQLAAYAKALEELRGIKVDRCGILWLKASTRTAKFVPKQGICQGEGWVVSFVKDIDKAFDVFQHVYAIYKVLYPKIEPYTKSFPTEIYLNIDDIGN